MFRRASTTVVILVVASAIFLVLSGLPRGYIDDTLITFRYAEVFVETGFPTWHPDLPVVDGFTSTGHMLLLAAGVAAGFGIVGFNSVLMFGSMAGLMIAVLLSVRRASLPARIVAIGLLVLNAGFAVWVGGGLDTLPFVLVFYLVYLAMERAIAVRAFTWTLALSLVALALMRPEGLVIALGIVAFWAIFRSPGEVGRRSLLPILAVIAFLCASIAVRQWLYGHPLPNAFYAKRSTLAHELADGARYFLGWIQSGGGILIVLTVYGVVRGSGGWLRLLFVVGLSALVVVEGGDPHPAYRFLLPLVPLIAMDAAFVFDKTFQSARPSRTWAMAGLCMVLYFGLQAVPLRGVDGFRAGVAESLTAIAQGQWPFRHLSDTKIASARVRAAQEISALLPPDIEVGGTDVGALAYGLDQPLIDVLGLNNAEYAQLPKAADRGTLWGVSHLAHAVDQQLPAFVLWFPEYYPWSFEQVIPRGPGCVRSALLLARSTSVAAKGLEAGYQCVSAPSTQMPGHYLNFFVADRIATILRQSQPEAEITRCVARFVAACSDR